jgi:hypothetical protein
MKNRYAAPAAFDGRALHAFVAFTV